MILPFQNPPQPRRHNRAIALVITLILLSAIGALTVIFLAMSSRSRALTTAGSSQTIAEFAAEAGREAAIAELVSRFLTKSNVNELIVLVSTNYINPLGFNPAWGASLTNVSYQYTGGAALAPADRLQNIANLYYKPRVPVFVTVPDSNAPDFRFYWDVDRNRTNQPKTAAVPGEPEFVGILNRPFRSTNDLLYPHSASNRFGSRVAWMAFPIGGGVDLNFSHNQNKRLGGNTEGFTRNQGVGSWEMNVAAFLSEISTDVWGGAQYNYNPSLNTSSFGDAFKDAKDLLTYRSGRDYNNLSNVIETLGPAAGFAFARDGYDTYGDGPLESGQNHIENDDPSIRPWFGSNNRNSFSTPYDLFDPEKTSADFVNNLNRAITLDPSAFSRMIAQISIDPGLSLPNEMNLNFANLGTNRLAAYQPWKGEEFMTNAVERLMQARARKIPALRDSFHLTNVTIHPVNLLSSTNQLAAEIFRTFQVGANLYNCLTNSGPEPFAPVSFVPRFYNGFNGLSVAGFREVTPGDVANLGNPDFFRPLNDIANHNDFITGAKFPHGIPVVVGARKGFPNFNEFSIQTSVQATRKLEFRKQSPRDKPNETNQLYILGISNVFGAELWNSYTATYPRPLQCRISCQISMVVTNELGQVIWPTSGVPSFLATSVVTNFNAFAGKRLEVPIGGTLQFPNSAYLPNAVPALQPGATNAVPRQTAFPVPQWGLSVTSRVQYILVDGEKLVDFVNIADFITHVDISKELSGAGSDGESSVAASCWMTNRFNGAISPEVPTEGIINQVQICLGNQGNDSDWRSYNQQSAAGQDREKAQDEFRRFMRIDEDSIPPNITVMQSPFNTTRKFFITTEYQANDPLVHYTFQDLYNAESPSRKEFVKPVGGKATRGLNLGKENPRYSPWGGGAGETDPNARNPNFKDAGVTSSDAWDFPTNRFPSVGWLGKVHRGTPWQTLSLKALLTNSPSAPFAITEWRRWAGTDATYPTNDWAYVDVFTAAPNDNARRGRISINQTNLASWSAVLSSMPLNTNQGMSPAFIEPSSRPDGNKLVQLVTAINRARGNRNANPTASFNQLGDLLAVPALTVESPYLNPLASSLWTDSVYERIPQQALGLLTRGESRYAIYSWGQALVPAKSSLVTTPGAFFQMCTNYAIAGEVVTQTIVRFEFTDEDKNKPRVIIESQKVLPP